MAGPSQIPESSLDVYFGPLMDELQKLWKGVRAFDGSRIVNGRPQRFTLRAALFCTMHDWPGLLRIWLQFSTKNGNWLHKISVNAPAMFLAEFTEIFLRM